MILVDDQTGAQVVADGGDQADAGVGSDAGNASGLNFKSFDEALKTAIAEHNAKAATEDGGAPILLGASAVVIDTEHGVVHSSGYGAYAADRLYLIASASKILSAGVLMRLADQHLLDLDAPISTYLAEWSADSAVGKITVAQLLSNSSGLLSLKEVSAIAKDSSDPQYMQACQYTHRIFSLESCAQTLYGSTPPREPDSTFAYGGSQWQLAGAIAEKVSHKTWAELIKETYVEPCGTPSLGYTNQFDKAGGSLNYPAFFASASVDDLPVTPNPSIEGGGYVTAPDYAKLLQMHLRNGKCGDTQVLSPESVARMQVDRIKAYGGVTGEVGTVVAPGYGLGWWVDDAKNVVYDPGAYGAFPFIDKTRGYAAFIALEANSAVGREIGLKLKPALDAIFDSRPAH